MYTPFQSNKSFYFKHKFVNNTSILNVVFKYQGKKEKSTWKLQPIGEITLLDMWFLFEITEIICSSQKAIEYYHYENTSIQIY